MPFVILSAERASLSPSANARRTAALVEDLMGDALGLNVQPVLSYYKGHIEKSFMVHVDDDEDYDVLRWLAVQWNQESILIVDDAFAATLVFLADGSTQDIGTWTLASYGVPPADDGWTQHGHMYFACR